MKTLILILILFLGACSTYSVNQPIVRASNVNGGVTIACPNASDDLVVVTYARRVDLSCQNFEGAK